MNNKVNCIMLIDDNPDDNFFHERVIRKNGSANHVVAVQTGSDALQFLQTRQLQDEQYPDIIFLDINMPAMNGWEFLEEFKKLEKERQVCVIVIMLTTSERKPDYDTGSEPFDFKTKPLTSEMLDDVIENYFKAKNT